MNKLKVILLSIVALVALGGGGYWWWYQNRPRQFSNGEIVFSYQKDYRSEAISDGDGVSKPVMKLGVLEPRSTIELNKEIGASKASALTGKSILELMEYGAEKKLPLAYPNYSKIASERVSISGREIGVQDFSYTGTDQNTKLYVRLFMIPFGNDAYYITVQSTSESRFKNDSGIIKNSLKINQ